MVVCAAAIALDENKDMDALAVTRKNRDKAGLFLSNIITSLFWFGDKKCNCLLSYCLLLIM